MDMKPIVVTAERSAESSPREAFFDRRTGAFFRRVDWSAFWTVLLITLGVYIYTLAPTVTLEDSGELAVASDYLGVPHPPGYPIWTLLTWLFQWIFHGVEYFGQPNPAWPVGLFSAVCGALACAFLSLLVSRSGADMIRSMRSETELLGFHTESQICWVSGVAAGLLFAFSPVLWSQSVIVEVYSLNALFLVLLLVLTYRWMTRPAESSTLFITAYLFGLGLTNHQTLLFVALALLVAIGFRDRPLFRDCCAALCWLIAGVLIYQMSKSTRPPDGTMDMRMVWAILLLIAPIGIFLISRSLFTEWRRLVPVILLAGLGLSFYAYMPFSSDQNPPMNWGYPRTWEGFMHALTRGQYERVTLSNIFGEPEVFFSQVRTFFVDLREQFTFPTMLVALFPFFFLRRIKRESLAWLITVLVAFITLSVILTIFLNPKLDIQTLFIQRVQLIQSHAVFALWLGYGLIFALVVMEKLLNGRPFVKYVGFTAVAALPLVLVYQNAYDENQIRVLGGTEQRGHDFGWQFGNWQLRGAAAILEELNPGEPTLPNPEYPPEMGTNAVFFGGTDPGRFVPTYMIYSAKVRSDVYLITQNALADNTYMSVMRDLYGDEIWIPSQADSNLAFQQYVSDVQEGRIPAGADVKVEDGRVSVQGVAGVMMINGILSRMIFEENKRDHAFYVEESYVIPWMYPYLEPHGLILKLNSEPIQITPEIVKNDHEFWDWYTRRLLDDKGFDRDVVARKTFSKLRSAIAGIYMYRRMFDEAEYAFKQSVDLYPLSPEANFRLADMYMQMRRLKDAREVIEKLVAGDPGNERVVEFLNQIRNMETMDNRRTALEAQFQTGPGNINDALELSELYLHLQYPQQFEGLVRSILSDDNVPLEAYMRLAQLAANAQRWDILELTLRRYTEREPRNPQIWMDLAAVLNVRQQTEEALKTLRHAVELGGEPLRDLIRRDPRFDSLRQHPEFRAIVPPPVPGTSGGGVRLPMGF